MFEDLLVIEDHEANGVNQLTVKKGDVVRVIKKEETGVVKYCFHCVRVCMISKLIDTYHAQLSEKFLSVRVLRLALCYYTQQLNLVVALSFLILLLQQYSSGGNSSKVCIYHKQFHYFDSLIGMQLCSIFSKHLS